MRHMLRFIAAITAAIVFAAGGAVQAQARNPLPPKTLPADVIDAHLGYQKQTTCSPTAKPGTSALLNALIATWGGASWGISRSCSVGGTSEHKEGRALDWRMNVASSSERARVDDMLAWLTANNGEVAYRLGVMYVIWNQRIWSIYYQELGWRKMADRGSYTANHKDHVHISLSWDGAMAQTSWWTGVPVASPLNSRCGVNGAPACLPLVARASATTWPYQPTVVPPFLPAPWTIPGIGGSPQVGRTLTAVPGTWVPEGAHLGYQWFSASTAVPDATGATYVVRAEDIGRSIKVRVTATKDGVATSRTSDVTTQTVAGVISPAPKPTIEGTAATEQVLTAVPGAWGPEPITLSYRWRRDGTSISGATRATYSPTAADVGHSLSVKVTGRRPGFTTRSTYSASVKVVKASFATTPTPAIEGPQQVGGQLTVATGTWEPSPTVFRYQWYRNGTAIPDATAATYRLGSRDLGTVVQVRVKGYRPGYTSVYLMSVAGDPVGADLASSVPTISADPVASP